MQESSTFPLSDSGYFKKQVLYWAEQFSCFIFLDGHDKNLSSSFTYLIAVDALSSLKLKEEKNQFGLLQDFQKETKNKIFGYVSYDLKNEIEDLESANEDKLNLPTLLFFEPRYIIEVQGDKCKINRSTLEALHLLDQIKNIVLPSYQCQEIEWNSKITKLAYLNKVEEIRKHIEEGTVYELNLCRELFAEQIKFNGIASFIEINDQAKAPFSAFLKFDEIEVLCFSPERFLQLKKGRLLSQPIKGTVSKGKNRLENERIKLSLFNDEKERAENVMIVDLVRNDFAKSAELGSVQVDELFGIYEFENIIQMISTVSANKRSDIGAINAFKNTFPMGSMTGAPKIKAMELIEELEESKRGLYSGALGYFEENGDFDFNVMIRTMIYNKAKQYLSFQVGGAITYDSIGEKEWEETEIKVKSITKFLRGGIH